MTHDTAALRAHAALQEVAQKRITENAGSDALLSVDNLRVSFTYDGRSVEVVTGVSLSVHAGESLAIVGESGSGKSVTARTLVGLTGAGSTVTADRLELNGRDLRGLSEAQWRSIRGKDVGFVLQDALSSLDPLRPSGKEVEEALKAHRFGSREERRQRVYEVMREVGLPDAEVRAKQRSGELSGGLRQRALIAAGLVLDPPLLIADEPTTALDTTVQAQVIDLLTRARSRGKALLLISHDLAVVSKLADRILVMKSGEPVEFGTAEGILHNPQDAYTKSLIAAIPSFKTKGIYLSAARKQMDSRPAPAGTTAKSSPQDSAADASPILSLQNVSREFRMPGGGKRRAVSDVSFDVHPGETLGIVGESGSGKTSVARIALGLLEPDSGAVLLGGRTWSGISEAQRRPRRREISVVYQDPLGSFDPRRTVNEILSDALNEEKLSRSDRDERIAQLLEQVGLHSDYRGRNPRSLSGGQRQRVAIARALAPSPRLIVLDEAVSALDASIQAQVLDLFVDLQSRLGVSYLFISHDLGVISHMSDSILVMKDGEVVERGVAAEVFGAPQHPYTQLLVTSVRVDFASPGVGRDRFSPPPPPLHPVGNDAGHSPEGTP